MISFFFVISSEIASDRSFLFNVLGISMFSVIVSRAVAAAWVPGHKSLSATLPKPATHLFKSRPEDAGGRSVPMAVEAFDGASGVIAGPLKLSAQDWTDAWVPELAAWVPEAIGGLFLKGIGRAILGVGVGLGSLVYAATVGQGRDKKAALELAAHLLTHPNAPAIFGIVSTRGVTLESMTAELQTLRAAAATGNWGLAANAFALQASDVDAYFRSVGAQIQSLAAAPGPAAVGAPPAIAPSGMAEGVMAQVASAVGYGDVF